MCKLSCCFPVTQRVYNLKRASDERFDTVGLVPGGGIEVERRGEERQKSAEEKRSHQKRKVAKICCRWRSVIFY